MNLLLDPNAPRPTPMVIKFHGGSKVPVWHILTREYDALSGVLAEGLEGYEYDNRIFDEAERASAV